ncbi:fumarylacetoacetate hydrolase family protein [Campylobacter sp. MIT 21-1685]|uniref:fumarylacetoacetate hydrolase family protein n=1 Tax=unclassified Campylobacter TaxID=2593542 RepID=UPI00224B6A33|nr:MULTISPECIES: fumarylacetoacetate hydrolase family protein [unclassified Campylobacter]MCX2683461.1 fumarylacetoacetate hydrolase family protein [Campylobacter sp. MIT 21-1684]MCX2751717.1 fumarylacetoacetate hydrolase family protein [Campylobacter sp. MIT 21-1682]MCX2807919.1 fumarylacetoacetate hydrolase family protein [Campylobacter sp. MIT 21-1685]
MKFVNILWDGKPEIGVLNEALEVVFLKDLGIQVSDMNDFIIHFEKHKHKLQTLTEVPSFTISKEFFLAPIEEPKQDIICLGINFLDHAKESATFKGEKFEERKYPVYFSKRCNKASAPYAEIESHKDLTTQFDYECELAFVLGKEAYKIKAQDAYKYIFGYTIINELSARDLQKRHKQFYRAKSLEGSTVMGPYLVSADEITYPPQLKLQSFVNGEIRQNSHTKFFIFDIAYVLEELSAGMRLKAGTIISMGTPSGVGMSLNSFLKSGDEVRCTIENLGEQCNKVK